MTYNIGDVVEIYDDGKMSRKTDGEVVFVISEKLMVVKFDPWGYEKSKRDQDTHLVFHKAEDGEYWHALNPRSPAFVTDAEPKFLSSEYCLIKG